MSTNHKGRTGVFKPTPFTFTCIDGTVIEWIGRGRLPLEAKNRLNSVTDGPALKDALQAHKKVKPSTGKPKGRPKGYKMPKKTKVETSPVAAEDATQNIIKATEDANQIIAKTAEITKETIATFS
jgi:hypothetical protein